MAINTPATSEQQEDEALHYTIIKVARDKDLAEQIGRHIYFDLVDHEKVHKFRIHKQTPFNIFKEEVAKEFGIPVQFQRFWIWAKRMNNTYRPYRPLTPQEESQSVGQFRGVSSKRHNGELKLFLEVEFGLNLRPIPPPDKTKEDVLLFFKLYEPEKQELRFVGRLSVKSSSRPVEILAKLNRLAGFSFDEEIEIYEEIRFEPSVMCERLDKMTSFQLSQIQDGDIICFQKSTTLGIDEGCKYPDVSSFLDYVHNRQIVHVHSLEKPMEEDFCLELSKLHSYDDVVEKLAHHIGLENPTKIRLTAHNRYSQQPKRQPIKYQGVEQLTEMLTHNDQSSDILYYEVLDIPLPELESLKTLKIAFYHATNDEVGGIHSIRLPKQSTVGDVVNLLKTKVELSHPNAELRLLEVFDHKIYKIFPNSEKFENINDQYWTIRGEEIPEEEKNLGLDDILIHVYHFTKVAVLNQMVEQVKKFGEPFVLVIHGGETLAEVKIRIQKKLQVPDEEFSKWKFAFVSVGRPEYLQDSDIVSRRFESRDKYGAWEQYLGLQHSDKAPKRARAANQASAIVNISFPTTMDHAEPTPQEDIRLKKEQEEKEDKRRYKAQAHLYRIIKVARDEDLTEQIGRDIYFDLVDHDKVCSFRIQKQTPFDLFKEEVAKEFGIPVQFQRFWIWAKRQNHTYRPNRPLTPQEETQSVGQLREVSYKTHNAELKLFLEVEFGPDLRPIPPPDKTKKDILLFFKLYEPEKRELRFVGRFFVKSSSKPAEILGKLNQLAGFTPDEEIELYEEIKFEPCIMCEHLDKKTSFRLSQIEDGDIICFQKSTPLKSKEECKYPDVPSFLEYVHNRQVVHFRSLVKPKEEDFSLELSKLHTYDDVVEKLARQIGLEDPTKIRLTAHNCYSRQPKPQPIKFRGVEHLTDMLVHYNQSSDILYYEVLDIPLPELQGLKNLKVAFHHATKDEVVIHNIRLPKQSIVGDVINVLKTKVELSHPNAELRLLEVFYHKIYKIFPHSEKIENINDQYWTLRAEEIPEEQKNLGRHDRLIHVYHFTKDTAQNQMQVKNFGEPFFLVIHEGETLAEVKERIQKKLQVPDEEFARWKFAFLSVGRPEYLQDSDVVSSRFQRRDVYGAWEQYLGLEHTDKAPKRAHAANQSRDKYAAWEQSLGLQHSDKAPKRVCAANQASAVVNISFPTSICQAEPTPQEDAAQVTLESMASNVGHETASREIEMQNDDLDGPASPAVDRTLRRLSAAEDLLKSTSAREPSVEALAALDTVSRYARSSLDTLCTNGAYEEFEAALKLVAEQGMIPSTITSMFKDLLSSLEGEMPKYVDAVKELAQAEGFPVEHEKIKAQMGLAMQKCQERKDIVANYDGKVTELEAELARVKAERAEAMADLETAVDEMEPLKQRFADSSLKSENLIVRQTTLTLQKCGSVGTWAVLQDALKKYFKF